jgi:fluoride exporter
MSLSTFTLIIAIGLAGAVGAVARYSAGRFIAERITSQFPLGTFLINITGAFCIGLVFALTTQKLISPTLQSIMATGFLGGYTTFSTMSWEGTQMARAGSNTRSLLYFGCTFLFGLSACILGLMIGHML